MVEPHSSNFRVIITNFLGVQIFRKFMVNLNVNQRTSGSINAHLTTGPGIYFNAFIHVDSPRTRADNPLGTSVDVNRTLLSLCPFVASFKTISLKYDFFTIFFMFFSHVYSPRQGLTIHWGQKFYDNRKACSLPICCKFQNDLFKIWFYTHF